MKIEKANRDFPNALKGAILAIETDGIKSRRSAERGHRNDQNQSAKWQIRHQHTR